MTDLELKLLCCCFDAMQQRANPDVYFYCKDEPYSTRPIKDLYSYATKENENPIYLMSCVFSYYRFCHKNDKQKTPRVVSPNMLTVDYIEKAYRTQYKYDYLYTDTKTIYNRSYFLIAGAYPYFDLNVTQEKIDKWKATIDQQFLDSEEPTIEAKYKKQKMLDSVYTTHQVHLIFDGRFSQPALVSMFDPDIMYLGTHHLLMTQGIYHKGEPVVIDKILTNWYSFCTEEFKWQKMK